MKFILTFKTPDVVDQLEGDDRPSAEKFLKRWVKYGEYLTVAFDTKKGTAEVQKVKP